VIMGIPGVGGADDIAQHRATFDISLAGSRPANQLCYAA
jgi:hypothetical protein